MKKEDIMFSFCLRFRNGETLVGIIHSPMELDIFPLRFNFKGSFRQQFTPIYLDFKNTDYKNNVDQCAWAQKLS